MQILCTIPLKMLILWRFYLHFHNKQELQTCDEPFTVKWKTRKTSWASKPVTLFIYLYASKWWIITVVSYNNGIKRKLQLQWSINQSIYLWQHLKIMYSWFGLIKNNKNNRNIWFQFLSGFLWSICSWVFFLFTSYISSCTRAKGSKCFICKSEEKKTSAIISESRPGVTNHKIPIRLFKLTRWRSEWIHLELLRVC